MNTLTLWLVVATGPYAAGGADDVQAKLDLARFVYLTDITHTAKGSQATLYDQPNKREIKLDPADGGGKFQVPDANNMVRVEGKVIHLGPRDVLFSSRDKAYAIHLGQSIAQALE